MRKIQAVIYALVILTSPTRSQVSVTIYPGTELLNVIHVLSDSAQVAQSTYREDIIRYFGKYRDHPAVQKARDLPFINCDFPIRMSWAFYDFPAVKLHAFDTLGAYNLYFRTEAVLDYFRACIEFYKDSRFHRFYKRYRKEYGRWKASFSRNLQEGGLLRGIDSFYRVPPAKKIVITLGALNCGSYAIPDMNPINPVHGDKMIIMVAYGNIIGRRDSAHRHPDFYAPAWASQLVWHEMGHAYLEGVFKKYQQEIEALNYIPDRDTLVRKAAGQLPWSLYLNENVAQAVTSLLRIHRGVADREAEMKRIASGKFYVLAPLMMTLLQTQYQQDKYPDFNAFFPVLLDALRKQYPR